MSLHDFINTIRLILYISLTLLVLIISFIPEGWLFYFYVAQTPHPDIIHYLLSPLYFFIAYCITVLIYGLIHSHSSEINPTLPIEGRSLSASFFRGKINSNTTLCRWNF